MTLKVILFLTFVTFCCNANGSWQGSWKILTSCSGFCCCPNGDTIMHFRPNPNNNSEVIVVGAFDAGISRLCALLGWDAGDEIVWPWNVNAMSIIPHSYDDWRQFNYTISGQYFPNGTALAAININQEEEQASPDCLITLINNPQAWVGNWLVTEPCVSNDYCCCPKNGTYVTISSNPKNSSQIFVKGGFSNNSICQALGWNNGTATWPWGASAFDPDDQDHYYYTDSYGVVYEVTVSETQQLDYNIKINTDQFSVNGAPICNFQLSFSSIHDMKTITS